MVCDVGTIERETFVCVELNTTVKLESRRLAQREDGQKKVLGEILIRLDMSPTELSHVTEFEPSRLERVVQRWRIEISQLK